MYQHKTTFTDTETTDLIKEHRVPGKREGTTRKERIPYETMFMDYPYIVSLGWGINDGEVKEFIINQEGREIPKEASDIHGITTEIANASEHSMSDVLCAFINDSEGSEIIVGHNIHFDTAVIKGNVLREIQKKTLGKMAYDQVSEILDKQKRICTMRKTIKLMKKWPTLSELHQKLFRKGFDAHSAKSDVEACRRCYEWLLKKNIVPTWEKLQEIAAEKELKNA